MPPASPADALRFIGDIGVVGTRHCSFVLPASPRGVRAAALDSSRLADCSLLLATDSRCAALPPTISRAAMCTPSRTPLTQPPSQVHPASGTLTTKTHSSAAAFASMISTCAMSGQSPKASRLNLMTVKRYWSSLPYRLRSRLVLYSFPSSSASWCLRSSSGTRWVPVDSATTFVRRVLTERSLRTLRPPSFLESSAVWIALRTCVYVGGWVCGGWSACGPYGRCGLRLSFTDEKLCKSGCWFTRVVWHTALRVRCARCSSGARACDVAARGCASGRAWIDRGGSSLVCREVNGRARSVIRAELDRHARLPSQSPPRPSGRKAGGPGRTARFGREKKRVCDRARGEAMRTWRKADVTDAHPWVSSGSDSLAPGIIGCG